jgi:hypothetical protein
MQLSDNFYHQIAMLGMFTLAEARANHNIDVTGWTLLDEPVVTVNRNGTITIQIATRGDPVPVPVPVPVEEPVEEVPEEPAPPAEVE